VFVTSSKVDLRKGGCLSSLFTGCNSDGFFHEGHLKECSLLPPFPQSVHVNIFHICIFNHFHSLVHTVQEKSSGLKLSTSWTRSDIMYLAIITWVVGSFPVFVQLWHLFCLSFITFIHTMYVLTKDTNMSALCDVNDELMFINCLRHLLQRLMLWTVQITHIYLQPSSLRHDTILFRRPHILVQILVLAYFLLLFAYVVLSQTLKVCSYMSFI
jgi:hypothetical protein